MKDAPRMPDPFEARLIARFQNGDARAMETLFDLYADRALGLAVRLTETREDAEEVAQEAFVRALRAIAGFDAARPIRPWLLEIAANRCRTALARRARGHTQSLNETVEQVSDPRAGPVDPDDLAGELERALSCLRPEYRLVFVLFHDQNLSYDEIAQTVSRPIGTVKTWLHRARAELAEDLGRRGVKC